jgi:hypothetical protein
MKPYLFPHIHLKMTTAKGRDINHLSLFYVQHLSFNTFVVLSLPQTRLAKQYLHTQKRFLTFELRDTASRTIYVTLFKKSEENKKKKLMTSKHLSCVFMPFKPGPIFSDLCNQSADVISLLMTSYIIGT